MKRCETGRLRMGGEGFNRYYGPYMEVYGYVRMCWEDEDCVVKYVQMNFIIIGVVDHDN